MINYNTWQSARNRILSAETYLDMNFLFRSQDVFKKALNSVDTTKLAGLEDTEAELFRVMQVHFGKMEEYFCTLESLAREIYPARVLSKETEAQISSRTHRINEFYDDPLGVNALIRRKLYLEPENEPLTAQVSFGWREGEQRRLVYWLGKRNDPFSVGSRSDLSLGYFRPVVLKPMTPQERLSLEENIRNQLSLTQPPIPSF